MSVTCPPQAVHDAGVRDRPCSLTPAAGPRDLATIRDRTATASIEVVGRWTAPEAGDDPRPAAGPLVVPADLTRAGGATPRVAAKVAGAHVPAAVFLRANPAAARRGPDRSGSALPRDPSRPGPRDDVAAPLRAGDLAWTALAQWLSELTGRPIDDLTFGREPCPLCLTPRGRPVLTQVPDLHVSLSRTADLVAIAVAPAPVGIDVQGPHPRTRDLVRALHRVERAALASDPDPYALTRCWARKEAILKAVGVGVAHGVRHPFVGCGPTPAPQTGHELHDIDVVPDVSAAIAYAQVPQRRKATP